MFEKQREGICSTDHRVKGIFLLLPVTSRNLRMFMEALEVLHPGCCGHSLTFEEAGKIDDDVIKRYNVSFEVNKERREGSTEAWGHMRIIGKGDKWAFRGSRRLVCDYKRP